jgi:hypothetical protein
MSFAIAATPIIKKIAINYRISNMKLLQVSMYNLANSMQTHSKKRCVILHMPVFV